MKGPAPEFIDIPLKIVEIVDHEALLATLRKGPCLFRSDHHPVIKALYLQAQRQDAGRIAVKTLTLLQDGDFKTAYLVTLKETK